MILYVLTVYTHIRLYLVLDSNSHLVFLTDTRSAEMINLYIYPRKKKYRTETEQ